MIAKLYDYEINKKSVTREELYNKIVSEERTINKNFEYLKIANDYSDIMENIGSILGFDGIINKNWGEYVVFNPTKSNPQTQ